MSEISTEISAPAEDRVIPKPRRTPLDPALRARRDLAIFKKVEIEKWPHQQVASRFGLRRSRVTQIVKQVRLQLAGARADDPELECHLSRQRLQKELERLRLEYALEAAAVAMRRDTPQLVTNRTGQRTKGGEQEDWSEVVTRDRPANVQVIKTFLRVTRELGELNEREIASNPVGEKHTDGELFQSIANVLWQWTERGGFRSNAANDAFVEMVREFEFNLRNWLCYGHASWVRPGQRRDSDESER